MHHSVTSRFSVISAKLASDYLAQRLPWRVTEATAPNDKMEFHVTAFDLGIGEHSRVDDHLAAAKHALLAHETELDSLSGDCKYALWVAYGFPATEGAFNIYPSTSAALTLLQVELIFHLKPREVT